jgi:hypothetical protein
MPSRKRRSLNVLLWLLLLAVIVGGLFLVAASISYQGQQPSADLRYVGTAEVNDGGHLKFAGTFWISNRSEVRIMVVLKQIETRKPEGWTIYTNTLRTLHTLLPREAAQIKIDAPAVNGAWRIRLDTLGEMTGLARYWSFAKMSWAHSQGRRAVRPAFRGTIYDRPTEIVSSDITD